MIDRDIADEAAKILGTSTLRDTIDASFREVVNATRRLELISLLADSSNFDFQWLIEPGAPITGGKGSVSR